MPAWIYNNGKSLPLRVEIQNSMATLKDSSTISYKTHIDSYHASLLLGIYPHELQTYIHSKTYSQVSVKCKTLEIAMMSIKR